MISDIHSDLYIFQDNSDIDMNHVNRLISDYKQGYKLDDVLICKITDKFKRDLKALKEKLSGMSTHAKYAKTIDDELFTTTKKWILLDGNHRYTAALKLNLKTITAEVDDLTAENYVDYINDAYY